MPLLYLPSDSDEDDAPKAKKVKGDTSLTGLTIVFTGTLSRRRVDMEALAREAGAFPTGGVSSKTNIVVAGPGAGSKLAEAHSRGITVWSEEEFMGAIAEPKKAKKPKAVKKEVVAEEEEEVAPPKKGGGGCGVRGCPNPKCTKHYCKKCGDCPADHLATSCPGKREKCKAVGCVTAGCIRHVCRVCGDQDADHRAVNCPKKGKM
eukprot:PhF_6_TR17427/c0_g1_i1/m.26673